MRDTKTDRPVPVPRSKNAPKRPRVKQRPRPIHTTAMPEAPARGVTPVITG